MVTALNVFVVSCEMLCRLPAARGNRVHPGANSIGNARDLRGDGLRDRVLHVEDVVRSGFVLLGEQVRLVAGLDELHVGCNSFLSPSDASFHHVIGPQLTADAADLLLAALVMHGRRACDNSKLLGCQRGEFGDDLVRDSVAEVLLGGIAAQVGERKHHQPGSPRPNGFGRTRNKAVPALGQRLDEARMRGRVAERFPQPGHGAVQVVVEIDENVLRPEAPAQVLACDNFPGVFQQDEEIAAVNQLDGFSIEPRLRVRFSGPINPDTLRDGIFLVWLDDLTNEEYGLQPFNAVTPINSVSYDPATNTAFAEPDEILSQHRRYALVVTNAVRDARGDPVEPDPAFLACIGRQGAYCERVAGALGRIAIQLIPPRQVVGVRCSPP